MKDELTPKIITLHRYFIWADRMRVHFDQVLSELDSIPKPITDKLFKSKEGVDTFLYMSFWYSTFYVLIEGWQELKLEDKKIDNMLKSKNVALLKRYRNGVFHFQKEYYDKRFTELMKNGLDIANWIRDLSDEFSRWFLKRYGKLDSSI